jgi:hypothetical protein
VYDSATATATVASAIDATDDGSSFESLALPVLLLVLLAVAVATSARVAAAWYAAVGPLKRARSWDLQKDGTFCI